MSIQAMKQALEALGYGYDAARCTAAVETIRNAESALRAAIEAAEKQEPVAWMSPGKERLEFSRPDTVYGSHTIPLYKHPVASQFSVGVIDSDGYLYPDHPLEPGTVLYTHPQPAIPDGMVLVPARDTDSLKEIVSESFNGAMLLQAGEIGALTLRQRNAIHAVVWDVIEAMLSAAPKEIK